MPILRPSSASGTGWNNPANIFDRDENTSGSVSASRLSYSSKVLTLTFDFSSIIGTISSMTLYVIAKSEKKIQLKYM